MSITLSTGATLSVAKTYAPVLTLPGTTTTALSNTAPCVVTATHAFAVGDYVEMTSGWGLMDKRVFRISAVVGTTTFTLEGSDTLDQTKYPALTGTGSFRKIVTWSQLSQVKGISASGGTQNFANITSLTDTVERQIPTTKAAVSMTADVFDDPTLPWYADVSAADTARTPYGLLMSFPNGSKLCANAYWSLMKVPTMATNEALMTQITMSYAAEPMRYST